MLQIPLASACCGAETWPEASRFPVHLLTFAIRTLLIFAAEDLTVQLNWRDRNKEVEGQDIRDAKLVSARQ